MLPLRSNDGLPCAMNYLDSLTDFFRSPRWLVNLLLAGVCTLIPVVGPIVLLGWLAGGFWGRDTDDPATFPDFDFARFTTYLERGLWPFLVSLVVSLVFVPVIWAACFVPLLMTGMLADGHHRQSSGPTEAAALLGMAGVMGMVIVLCLALSFVARPLMLRAMITQDFGRAFDFGWAMRFLKSTWLECLLAAAFIWVASLVLSVVGMLALCIGIYFVSGLVYYAMTHLDRQLYQLFLARGGDPVEVSPKLRDGPPPVPAC